MYPMGWLGLLLLLGSYSLSFSFNAPDLPAPRYNISLDDPPELRWEPVLKHYNSSDLRKTLDHFFHSVLPEWVHAIIRPLAEVDLALFMHEPYAGEIRGIARTLGVSAGDIVALNLCYEATAFCTSIIAEDEKGHIYHGRNLDYDFVDILRTITMDLDFVRNGQVVYTGTTFLGYVGLWTGQSPYKFSISGDSRERGGGWWKNAISAFLKRNSLVSWLIRDVLNDATDFQSAALQLSKTPIIAEVYYIMGGTMSREGLVITRNRDGPADIWPLDPLRGAWFHVETNYDHWLPPPPSDDRRTPAIKALNATGQANLNADTLYKVLSVKPVLNRITVYTTIMSAAYPETYATRIRYDVQRVKEEERRNTFI